MNNELTYSRDNLTNAARFVIEHLENNSIVLMDGPMGAGKTTLITAICQELGVEDHISSPTFSIVNEYRNGSNEPIYHFDFYRIEDVEEAIHIGVEDYFYSKNLCFIEWASRVENIIPDEFILVSLSIEDEKTRKLNISYGR